MVTSIYEAKPAITLLSDYRLSGVIRWDGHGVPPLQLGDKLLDLSAQELANQIKIVAEITEKLLLHPFGVAYGLQNANGTTTPSVEYFANELLSSVYENTDVQQANRVLCGFAMLTLGPNSINEQFIDQTGEVRWSQTTAL